MDAFGIPAILPRLKGSVCGAFGSIRPRACKPRAAHRLWL